MITPRQKTDNLGMPPESKRFGQKNKITKGSIKNVRLEFFPTFNFEVPTVAMALRIT
jgi:hypothetical protein